MISKIGDTLFVGYSGHGSYLKDRGVRDEKDGKDETIYTVDEKFIIDDELNNILVKPLPEGAKLRVLMDCCHSGSGLDLAYRYTEGGNVVKENSSVIKRDIIMISGCRDNQTSADTSYEGKNCGALTYSFVKSLEMMRKTPYVTKGRTWKDLIASMRYRLLKDKYEQRPQLSVCDKMYLNQNIDLL